MSKPIFGLVGLKSIFMFKLFEKVVFFIEKRDKGSARRSRYKQPGLGRSGDDNQDMI